MKNVKIDKDKKTYFSGILKFKYAPIIEKINAVGIRIDNTLKFILFFL